MERDSYLKDICANFERKLLKFTPFESDDLVYDSPKTIKVTGQYAEIGQDSYKDHVNAVKFTIYKDIRYDVLGLDPQKDYRFFLPKSYRVDFSLTESPFRKSQQIVYSDAMFLADDPLFDLIHSYQSAAKDADNVSGRGSFRPSVAYNILATLEFIGNRGLPTVWKRVDSKGPMSDDEMDMGTTGLAGGTDGADFARFQNITKVDAAALGAISRAEKIRVSRSGPYLIFGLGNPVSFLSVVALDSDRVSHMQCGEGKK
jgi:hypothetical protein